MQRWQKPEGRDGPVQPMKTCAAAVGTIVADDRKCGGQYPRRETGKQLDWQARAGYRDYHTQNIRSKLDQQQRYRPEKVARGEAHQMQICSRGCDPNRYHSCPLLSKDSVASLAISGQRLVLRLELPDLAPGYLKPSMEGRGCPGGALDQRLRNVTS